jgi:hypothetical protein
MKSRHSWIQNILQSMQHALPQLQLGDSSLHQQIKSTQEYDKDVSMAIETILKNGPRSLAKGLEEWNLEDGIILHKGQVYIPKNEELRRDIYSQEIS